MARIVIGGGPSGLRAAALLPAATLLDPDPTPGGMTAPELPEDRGVAQATHAAQVARVYGAAPALGAEALGLGVWLGGRLLQRPISRAALLGALPRAQVSALLRDLARARGRIATQRLIGGGKEERVYRDWVVHRYGETAMEQIFGYYARARFGDPGQVNVSAARQHHALDSAEGLVGLGVSPAQGWARLSAGLRVQPGVKVLKVELAGGRVARLLTSEGALELDGELWVAAPLPELLTWMPEALAPSLRWQLDTLRGRTRVRVALRRTGGGAELPAEVHVLDPAPFFRILRPELRFEDPQLAGLVLVDLSLDPADPLLAQPDAALAATVGDALRALGLPAVETDGARVRRLPNYDPTWWGPWHPRHTTATMTLHRMGVRLVGRSALHRYVDPGQELALVEGLSQDADRVHELHRTLLDPPVILDDLNVPLTRLVER